MIYRDIKMLKQAKHAPHCMVRYCRAQNYGQIVACHSNEQAHGKGIGIKSHDLTAFMCNHCHDIYDGRVPSDMTKAEKQAMFLDAVYFSMLWLFQTERAILK